MSFDYVAMAAQITGLDTATLMRPRQQVGGRGASGVASEDRAEAELSGRLLAGFLREAHGRHARLTGDFEGERACGSAHRGPPAAGMRAERCPTRQTVAAISASAAARKMPVSSACSGQ